MTKLMIYISLIIFIAFMIFYVAFGLFYLILHDKK